MPAPTPCPVSNIDRALSSYVNSREETLKIRRTLAKYLTASFRPVHASIQTQHLTHECPQNHSAASTNPPGLRGVRVGYLEALRAKHAAQMRHRELQESLDELQNRHNTEPSSGPDSQYDDEILRNYINLIRQRRAFSELQVIQGSLEKLLDANPVSGPKDPRTLVTKAIGEQPNLPAERLEQLSYLVDGSLVLKVKQEVIEANSAMEQAKAARIEAKNASKGEPQLQKQVYALGCARGEMVEWVQDELAKMEEESEFIDDASPVKRSTEPAIALDLASSEALIHSAYEKYTTSRSVAIKSHESIQFTQPRSKPNTNQLDHGVSSNTDSEQQCQIFTKMLPHLPNLARLDSNERALLQQAVYLQAQINTADEETAEHLSRLAGESHLLPSTSRGVESWGNVAAEVEKTNANFVLERVQQSRQEINSITAIVDLCSMQSQVLSSK